MIDQQVFDDYNAAMSEDNLKTPDVIYLDIRFVKDLYLGAILLTIDNQEQYKLLYDNITTYNERVIDDIGIVLPELGITNDRVLETMKTKADKLYDLSPVYTFMTNINDMLINVNHKCTIAKKLIIPTLIINVYPAKLSDAKMIAIGMYYIKTYGIRVKVISKPFKEIDPKIVRNIDLMYLYDLESFVSNPDYTKGFQDMKFEKLDLISVKRVANKEALTIHKTKADLDKDFLMTECYINLMCNFAYIPNLVVYGTPKEN